MKTASTPDHDPNEFRDEIKCPSCGKNDWETTEYPRSLQRDGDTAETECDYCSEPMKVTLCVEYSYATAPLAICTFPGCRAPREYPGHQHSTGRGDEMTIPIAGGDKR